MSVYDELTFAPMLIKDVFDTYRQTPAWLNTNQVLPGEQVFPHVTNSALGNSVAGFISHQEMRPNRGNAITVGIDTQVVAYQPVPFYGATKVYELRSQNLDSFNGLVLTSVLRRAIEKFSWGYKASAGRLVKTRIMVPVVTDNSGGQVVDWEGMTRFGEELRSHTVTRARNARTSGDLDADTDLPDLRFEPMFITDVFMTMKAAGKWFDMSKARTRGAVAVPYVARSGGGNGIGSFLPHQGFEAPNSGNAITIGVSTSTVFYQPSDFYTSKEIQVLRHRELNALNAPLLVSALRDQMHKFAWGNGASLDRLKATRIMVPVTTDNSSEQVVDWEGMTLYGQILRARVERAMTQALP